MSVACPVCGKTFGGRNRKQNLGFHMLIHTGEKRHQCPYCPHKSTLKSNLNKHIRTMHGDSNLSPQSYPTDGDHGVGPRALMCPFCNKVFAGRNQHQRLRYHTLTHTGEKPHACPFCPHRARLKFNLHKHIRALHKDQLHTS
ncbi:RE1-silencing transcription factor A [Chionoecetes opilio]|uniref:RE1-silencing transcription factor A n=1 Tax=Chionoecetes opilio TaxID=41210 RepID=A0A8J4YHT0_CHIOP|nr:RE1-silencing transcription factor A [Chionoecetes opilio]